MSRTDNLKKQILTLVQEYYLEAFLTREFNRGETTLSVSGRVFDADELVYLVEASLDFWLTTGRFAEQFEREFARFFGLRYAMLTNSGSSANLLALSALTSPKLEGPRLLPGDEVITIAAGFPTTVNPIIQHNLVPVFLDIEQGTYNVDVRYLENAVSDRTRAIMLAHTLGNPFNLDAVLEFARKYSLWVIEDCCDAVGSMYKGRVVGTFGDLATVSFYPAHHITMGEGGCVLTNSPKLKVLVESFRDWGRDCWCDPGTQNTCGKRFGWHLGELPEGYDHKYIYSHIGYNLKITDLQAAVGVAQLKKLPRFIEARKRNFRLLYEGLKQYDEFLILPRATPGADPSWFGFPIAVPDATGFSRADLVGFLESRHIATRMLFGGNLVRQPAYAEVKFRQVGPLTITDFAMNNAFWVGVYPGLTSEMIEYIVECVQEFLRGAKS